MLRRIFRPLDRYVFSEFWRIFLTTAVGFPLLIIVIDIVDNLDKYLAQNISRGDIAVAYLYGFPESAFLVMPAAVLFATVFSIGNFTRHSEITAAKASGISFYRLVLPVFLGAIIATGMGLALGQVAPAANQKRTELLGDTRARNAGARVNFAFAGDEGQVYKIASLNATAGTVSGIEIERHGTSAEFPSYVLAADRGHHEPESGWTLVNGVMHIVPDTGGEFAIRFDSTRALEMSTPPRDFLDVPRAPEDLSYRELGRYITTLERSGGDADKLRVERMLKIAIPVTCMIIALFGAPLATSTQRGGAAYGVGISLGTTIVFLLMIQLTRAIGSSGLMSPELAAWIPSIVFGVMGAFFLIRVRT